MMDFFRKTVKIVAFVLVWVMAVSMFAACKSDKNKTYEKTFPNVNEIEYDTAKYLKAPKLSDVVLYKNQIDNAVNYALVSILLHDAERTSYTEADSADVALYDTVNITFTGVPADTSIKLDENILASMSNASSSSGTNLVIGSGSFIGEYRSDDPAKNNKGFEEQLIGVKVGSTVDILVTFPDAYNVSDLCGLAVKFTVTVNSIDRPTLGELTDDVCKSFTGFETVESYREHLEEYYSGAYAYDAVYNACEIIDECKELIDVYIDKYIHDNIIYIYGKELTQKEYDEAYEDLYSSNYDSARQWAVSVSEERIILKYLFENCKITLSDKEFEEMLDKDWEENKLQYEQSYGAKSKEEVVETLGRDELEVVYMFEKMIKVLPDFITIAE